MRFTWVRTLTPIGLAAALILAGRAEDAERPVSPSAQVGSVVAAHRFSPGKWSIVGFQAANPTEQPARLCPSVYFGEDPNVQFGRELWIPPRAQRSSWCPVRVPDQIPRESRGVEIRSVAEDRSKAEAVRLPPRGGGLWSSQLLPLAGGRSTAAIFDRESGAANDEAYEVIHAMQAALGRSVGASCFNGDFLSPTAEGLDPFDQLVICGDRPADEVAGRAAIRQWLRGGGRLWIMLDRVQPETVRLLLGEVGCYEVVDRVGL